MRQIKKRNGALVNFDLSKIENAVFKAMSDQNEGSEKDAKYVAMKVNNNLLKNFKDTIPTVEDIQDTVEKELILCEYVQTAKAYILYRDKHAKLRNMEVPDNVQQLVDKSKQYFKNSLGEFIYFRSYSKWIEEEQRRETWIETVDRYMSFMKENLGYKLKSTEYNEIREFILKQKAMPSMRLMWSAGKAARRCNACVYNCSYIAPSKLQDFGEIMYLSMCGCGVGFSVESFNVQKLPQIKIKKKRIKKDVYVVKDSKEGWADAYVYGLKKWFKGEDAHFDYSQLRPEGAKLKTMGGKSSGPGPLKNLIDFSRERIFKRQGKRLTNLDVHDLVCKIGEIVVSGGVRRTALISLSDLDDNDMRLAKNGQFYLTNGQRSMANISTAYNDKPSTIEFMDEWIALMKSGTGERGIYNRGSLQYQLPDRRKKIFNKHKEHFGTNPCGEIGLQSKQFCNLTEIVAREDDTEKTLLEKARIAAILGTYQATLTHFEYLSKKWTDNCEEERLLGVSITGQWDSDIVRNKRILQKIKDVVIETNEKYSKRFGITPATCTTCCKPSGCTTLDTKIITMHGEMSMQEIFNKNGISNISGKNTWITPTTKIKVKDENNNWQEIIKLYINGEEEIYEIQDDEGNIYKFTGNHQLKTTKGWRRVDKLTINDNIISFK